jgi:hypothetical protein
MDSLCFWCKVNEGSEDDPCQECKLEMRCNSCFGSGQIPEMRDSSGRLDYLHGNCTGRFLQCQRCEGNGWAE